MSYNSPSAQLMPFDLHSVICANVLAEKLRCKTFNVLAVFFQEQHFWRIGLFACFVISIHFGRLLTVTFPDCDYDCTAPHRKSQTVLAK